MIDLSQSGVTFHGNISSINLGRIGTLPILTLFDFAAAFPSVAHLWLFMVLSALKIPNYLMNAIKKLYDGNRAFAFAEGG